MGYSQGGLSAVASVILFSILPIIQGCSGSSDRAGPVSSMSGKKYVSGENGGKIIKYAIKVKRLENSGKLVQFAGTCNSACTLYLGLPRHQTCISPGAKFRFHMPYGVSGKGREAAKDYMMRSYPVWVRSWIRRSGGLTNRTMTMNYDYASRYIRPCKVKTA